MADQQFLASFGVDIDESGVSRLQTILTENRTLAESLSSAFDAASESVRAFREEVATDLPTLFSGSGYGHVTESLFGDSAGLKIGLNMTEPKKEISAFTADAKKPIDLSANASAIVSAARTAMEQVRSLFSETFILNVRAETNTDREQGNSSARSANAESQDRSSSLRSSSAGSNQRDTRSSGDADSAFLRMSSGGRFSQPTSVQVAEDGDAEYIIPVKKENRALPLLRQLLSELSPEARKSLNGSVEQDESNHALPVLEKSEQPPASDMHLPSARESLSEEVSPKVSVQIPSSDLFAPAAAPVPAVEKEQADRSQAPAETVPDLRQAFAEADHPLASAPVTQKEAFPSASDSPKQNLSDLVSQLSSVLRPSGSSVTNTSNNLSAPVTINVNAGEGTAGQIGQSIYDTAERYLLRTLRGAFT